MIIFKLLANVFLFAICFCANDDTPQGLRCWGPCLRIGWYKKDSGAGVIGIGSLVKREADGCIDENTANDGKPSIGVALAYSAASTEDAAIPVADHPHQKFVIQDDGGTTLDEEALGASADIVPGTVNTTTGVSHGELNSTVTTAGALKIHALAPTIYPSGVKNDWGAWQDLIVTIAEHFYNTEAGI